MKIWFDLSNSPHINMFYDMIKDLENEGHTIIITSRPLANTLELLKEKNLEHTVVGEHYGKSIFKKIFGYPIRIVQLKKHLSALKPDLAVSQSSFHSPVVAKWLGVPSIYTNDNEHALGNIICFLFADRVLIPEKMSISSFFKLNRFSQKFIRYPGVKEGIYLWSKADGIYNSRKSLEASHNPILFIRPEPLTAQYYNGKQNFLDDLLFELQHACDITVLPRDKTQARHYADKRFSQIHIPPKPLSFDDIASSCTLFIGAGGSMTRELAMIGIPTISVYQGELLEVDKLLISKGLMHHIPDLNTAKVFHLLKHIENQQPSTELVDAGKAAYHLFKREINRFACQ
ncbi:MAG: DUF354 domain-containing protein [bacterium]|jgi:predicted glycosyltransferase